jgi:hypothetical protein
MLQENNNNNLDELFSSNDSNSDFLTLLAAKKDDKDEELEKSPYHEETDREFATLQKEFSQIMNKDEQKKETPKEISFHQDDDFSSLLTSTKDQHDDVEALTKDISKFSIDNQNRKLSSNQNFQRNEGSDFNTLTNVPLHQNDQQVTKNQQIQNGFQNGQQNYGNNGPSTLNYSSPGYQQNYSSFPVQQQNFPNQIPNQQGGSFGQQGNYGQQYQQVGSFGNTPTQYGQQKPGSFGQQNGSFGQNNSYNQQNESSGQNYSYNQSSYVQQEFNQPNYQPNQTGNTPNQYSQQNGSLGNGTPQKSYTQNSFQTPTQNSFQNESKQQQILQQNYMNQQNYLNQQQNSSKKNLFKQSEPKLFSTTKL